MKPPRSSVEDRKSDEPILLDVPLSDEDAGTSPSAGESAPGAAVVARPQSTLRGWLEALALAVLLAFLVRSFAVQAFKIPSASMLPTLQIGDHLLINKLRYGIRSPFSSGWLVRYDAPDPGDVIVFVHPTDVEKDFIKRVVAVEGEEVEIRDKQVLVDGRPRDALQAYYADGRHGLERHTQRDNFGPRKVPKGFVFVLGDNRDRSFDSRFWGFVDLDDVKGKAVIIYWSWDGRDGWVRWERLGEVIR